MDCEQCHQDKPSDLVIYDKVVSGIAWDGVILHMECVGLYLAQNTGVTLQYHYEVEDGQKQEQDDRTPSFSDISLSRCTCEMEWNDPGLYTLTGPHHSEGCPLYELPDYGVFGPDE